MFGVLDIPTSAMVANRQRLETTAANLANFNSILDAQGNYSPYRRRVPVLATGDPSTGSSMGVHLDRVINDPAPFRKVYEPGSPYADADGYVEYPNIDPSVEMINALEASRAYEANVTSVEATKSMLNAALRLLA